MAKASGKRKVVSTLKSPVSAQRKLPHGGYVVVDRELCVGCGTCELVCSLSHEGESNPYLARLRLVADPFTGAIALDTCRQCAEPACFFACPVEGALVIDKKTAARIIVEDKCIACGACARVCPYNEGGGVIRLNPVKNVYFKCDLCSGDPRCVSSCQVVALKYKGSNP